MNANYFSHDSNARNDSKLLRLRMKHGAAGYGVYFMLLERLRDEQDYVSVKDYNMIAFDLRVDSVLIKSVVEDFGLFAFTEDSECFYSESFNRRMSMKDEKSAKRAAAGRMGGAPLGNRNAAKKAMEILESQEQPEGDKEADAESKQAKNKQKQANACFETSKKSKESKESKESKSSSTTRARDGDFLSDFLSREEQVERLCIQLHIDRATLAAVAHEVLNEWELTEQRHSGYNDAARHLISQLRIKLKAKENGNGTIRAGDGADADTERQRRVRKAAELVRGLYADGGKEAAADPLYMGGMQ